MNNAFIFWTFDVPKGKWYFSNIEKYLHPETVSVLRPAAIANRKTANSALNAAVNDWKNHKNFVRKMLQLMIKKNTQKMCQEARKILPPGSQRTRQVRRRRRWPRGQGMCSTFSPDSSGEPRLPLFMTLVNGLLWNVQWTDIVTFTLMVDINPLALIQSVTVAAETQTMLWIWNIKAETPQLWWNNKFDLTR